MGQFSSFDELPLIVHDGILCSLASPRDVANTIRASPGCLQAFVTGHRNIVLLAALKNCLSLENQHLMNLVIAAPHYYKPEEADNGSTVPLDVDFDGVSRADFDRELRDFLHNFHLHGDLPESNMRPLTMNTLHWSIRLYDIMDKEIRSYGLFTLARSQRRIERTSNPRMFTSHYHLRDCDRPGPDDRESERIWRSFLLHELFCIMHGMTQVSGAASNNLQLNALQELRHIFRFFRQMSAPVCEGIVCVQQYMRDQYALAFNSVVRSFELAASETGRCDSDPAIVEQLWEDSPTPVRYLFGNPDPTPNGLWIGAVAMLGVGFLREFFSLDSTARLDFIRATYPFFNESKMHRFPFTITAVNSARGLGVERFGWSRRDIDMESADRLRAVGWVFWENPDRLASMDLIRGPIDGKYQSGSGISIPGFLKLRSSIYFVDKSLEQQNWEDIIKEFGTPSSKGQLDKIKSLFKSIGTLNPAKVAEIVSASRGRHVEGVAAEIEDNSD